MTNPYALLAALILAICLFGSGVATGVRWEDGKRAINDRHIAQAVDAANTSSAEAIAKIKPVYTTIQGKVIHETSTKTVYADCHHSPDGLQFVNQALNGGVPIGDSRLPQIDSTRK